MTTGLEQPAPDPTLALLQEACDRNLQIELHRRTAFGATPTARGRMLRLEDGKLYLDRPQTIGRPFMMSVGQACRAYFSLHETIYMFETRVAEADCRVRLNVEKSTIGMALEAPESIRPGQRREFFRTSLALQGEIAVQMHEAGVGDDPAECPVDARRLAGKMTDASGGGVGVVIEGRPAKLRAYDPWFVGFRLPGSDDQLVFLAELRQIRGIRDDQDTRLGLMFLIWPNQRVATRTMDLLLRYLSMVQRASRKAG